MITISGLAVTLGSRQVLRGVDLHVPAGRWLAVIGPNGAGKSTLLKAIMGLVAQRGEVTIGQERLSNFLKVLAPLLVEGWPPAQEALHEL